jgi:transposase-like protein
MPDSSPKTLQEAIRHFSDEQTCIDAVAALRWPDGKPTCPACGGKEHWYLKRQRRWKCKECWKQFSVKVGTIFEDSPIGLDKWLCALWMLCNCKNGISSWEIHRDIRVTQKSAWFMLHRLRLILQDGCLVKLGATGLPVEVDETFIGGKARNMHRNRRLRFEQYRSTITNAAATDMDRNCGKAIVMGMLERGGKVKAQVVPDRRRGTLEPVAAKHIEPGGHVITDEWTSYYRFSEVYTHEVINHLECYVRGHIHTNGIENFWSLLKRGLNGTYISVEPFHLFRYVDEEAFRFNNRATKDVKRTDYDRFKMALSHVGGKRITYAELTGKTGAAPPD